MISPSIGQNGIIGYEIIKELFELKGYGIEEAHTHIYLFALTAEEETRTRLNHGKVGTCVAICVK